MSKVEHYDSANCDCVDSDEVDALRAEIERLKAELVEADRKLREYRPNVDHALAEIEKLRAIVDAARQCPVCRVAHKDLFAALQDESPR